MVVIKSGAIRFAIAPYLLTLTGFINFITILEIKVAKRESIPKHVKEILRREVGFGCPVRNCGNPYLEYHHFDPPVHVKPHNNPEGMIALCPHHHKKADGNAYTIEQLHEFKQNKVNSSFVCGNLEWLRRDILSIVGGNAYYETPIPVQIDGHNVVKFTRDELGYQRLSIKMLSLAPEERIIIDENSWENIGNPIDLRSPPQGKELEVIYMNGDYLHLKFLEIKDAEMLKCLYEINTNKIINFPITAIEINFSIAGTTIEFKTTGTKALGTSISRSVSIRCGIGMMINTKILWQQNPRWKLQQKYEVTGENIIKARFGK